MAGEPIATIVPKVVTPESTRKEVVTLLHEALALAEAGEIEECVLFLKKPGGYWMNRQSAMLTFCEWIGRLEIAKQDMIHSYLDETP